MDNNLKGKETLLVTGFCPGNNLDFIASILNPRQAKNAKIAKPRMDCMCERIPLSLMPCSMTSGAITAIRNNGKIKKTDAIPRIKKEVVKQTV
jgi:hypothetical protein